MNEEEKPKVVTDAFGTDRNVVDGKPVVAPAPAAADAPAEGADKGEAGKEKKPDAAADDIEKNPVVISLRQELTKLATDKESMGGNLSEQGKLIKKLTDRIADIESGKAGSKGAEPLFKDIKRVKDLPADQQEAMTDSEKKLFDTLADTQERMNSLVADAAKKEADAAATAEQESQEAIATEEFNGKAQSVALALVGVSTEPPTAAQKALANAIIEEFNLFADNDKLNEKELKERMEKAAKLVPDYKPVKEQGQVRGAPAKPVDANNSSEIDKIVEEVKGGKTGGTYAL